MYCICINFLGYIAPLNVCYTQFFSYQFTRPPQVIWWAAMTQNCQTDCVTVLLHNPPVVHES